jgi:hypothetical protein
VQNSGFYLQDVLFNANVYKNMQNPRQKLQPACRRQTTTLRLG